MNAELQNKTMREEFQRRGYTGKRCILHLLDTGDKRADRGDKVDTNGHGTFVANQVREAMPDVTVCSHKIVPGGIAVMRNALEAVYQEARADRGSFHIVNMSVSLETSSKTDSIKELERTLDKLVAYGVPVICAAGNDNRAPMFMYPACFHSSVCTTAIYSGGDRAPFSNFPDEADFTDHGVNVTVRGETKSGTSMSSPQVCWKYIGMACEYEAKNKKWPTDAQLYEIAKARVSDLGDIGLDPYFGWGFVDITQKKKETLPMLDYVVNIGLKWPDGRTPRDVTDHIQIHHTVGDYSTASRWAALHQKRITEDGWRGIEYSFGINADGVIFDGRGLQYKHGAVKNTLTKNKQGIGAADRSVAITLIGDMRKSGMPTAKQLASAVRLVKDLMAYYNLPASAVLGHTEVPTSDGGDYSTECPCLDMDNFRALLTSDAPYIPEPTPDPDPVPEPDPLFPAMYYYGGSTYVNLRVEPRANSEDIGDVVAREEVIVLSIENGWAEVIKHTTVPMKRGYCISNWLVRG